MSFQYMYRKGFAQSIVRQRLGKHDPTLKNGNYVSLSVDECYISLLGSSQLANGIAG
jgi:hypothetical protein